MELWEAFGELWEGLKELWGALEELWEGLEELWKSPGRLYIQTNSRSTAPADVMLITKYLVLGT